MRPARSRCRLSLTPMASCGLPLAALMEGGDPPSGPLGPTRRTGSAHVGLPAHVVQLFGLPWRQAHTFPFTADPWPVLRGWPPGKDTRVQGQHRWAPSQTWGLRLLDRRRLPVLVSANDILHGVWKAPCPGATARHPVASLQRPAGRPRAARRWCIFHVLCFLINLFKIAL